MSDVIHEDVLIDGKIFRTYRPNPIFDYGILPEEPAAMRSAMTSAIITGFGAMYGATDVSAQVYAMEGQTPEEDAAEDEAECDKPHFWENATIISTMLPIVIPEDWKEKPLDIMAETRKMLR